MIHIQIKFNDTSLAHRPNTLRGLVGWGAHFAPRGARRAPSPLRSAQTLMAINMLHEACSRCALYTCILQCTSWILRGDAPSAIPTRDLQAGCWKRGIQAEQDAVCVLHCILTYSDKFNEIIEFQSIMIGLSTTFLVLITLSIFCYVLLRWYENLNDILNAMKMKGPIQIFDNTSY